MSKNKTKLSLRLDFNDELLEMLMALQKHFQIKNATDLIRFLVASEYRRLKSERALKNT